MVSQVALVSDPEVMTVDRLGSLNPPVSVKCLHDHVAVFDSHRGGAKAGRHRLSEVAGSLFQLAELRFTAAPRFSTPSASSPSISRLRSAPKRRTTRPRQSESYLRANYTYTLTPHADT